MNEKLKDIGELKNIVGETRRNGGIVVFANGVFDILHVGHVRYLREARSFGDILIVALNSDVSTRKIKGESRPYTGELERAEILSGLEAVDYIILFDDADVKILLTELKPDIHAKGTDYTADTVPERDVVRSYGGRVMIAGDEKTHSSSEMIDKLITPKGTK